VITIVGAGLAGLACAVALAESGREVTLLEAGPAAGGRARSYDDRELGCRLDNGNHLLLSGNTAAYAYLDRIGAAGSMAGPVAPVFPFIDLRDGARWTLRPGRGRLPLWVFDARRRVPGTTPAAYLSLARWLHVAKGALVSQIVRPGVLHDRLIEPLAIAALNTMPDEADASLMAAVMRQSLLRGGAACIPSFPRVGLSESFVDPALALLARQGTDIHYGRRVSGLDIAAGRVTGLATTDGAHSLGPTDTVVLAVSAPIAASLLPALTVPDQFEAILNLHFRIQADPGEAGFVGVVGGLSEWIFVKSGVVSVTISAANRHADLTPTEAAERVWGEVAQICGLAGPMPPVRVVREKRATFAATPAQNARRPGPRDAGLANLILAGDWTATGLPATIEGAIRSGNEAARLALSQQV
jgi:squalene-associated FAD-dependent desaturase